jgi:hypothetical protein
VSNSVRHDRDTDGDIEGYELAFAPAIHGLPRDVVVVLRSDRTGPGGHPVYLDATGIVSAEISDRGEARMIATGIGQRLSPPVEIRTAGRVADHAAPAAENHRMMGVPGPE